MTGPGTRRPWALLTGVLLFLSRARSAEAHLAVADSALFSGLLQPGAHAEGFLLVAALGLWSGLSLRGYRGDIRFVLGCYGAGFGVGAVSPIVAESWLAVGSLLAVIMLSLAVAFERPWGVRPIMAILAIGGWTVAMFGREGLAMGFPGSLFFVAGHLLSSLSLLAVMLFMARSARGRILRIGIRMAASWMVAISAMILAFSLRGGLLAG